MAPILYVVGDIHLRDGRPCAFTGFLDRLAGLAPARLVILGDLFEYWLETDDAVARYEPVLSRVRALGAAGWRVDVVRGNREMAAGRRLEAACAAPLHWPGLTLALGPRRIRIVHGDRLVVDPGYRALRAWIDSFWHRAWQVLHPAVVQDAVARWMRRRSRGNRPYRGPPPFDPGRLRGTARGVDTVIAGHIHDQWRRSVAGVDLLLVGDWPHGGGRWIEGYADGTLRLCAQPSDGETDPALRREDYGHG